MVELALRLLPLEFRRSAGFVGVRVSASRLSGRS